MAIDLFAGAAAAWTLGLHRAGIRTVAACEADPWRRAAYAVNFPEVRIYDDVRWLDAAILERRHGRPFLVAGSPPCTDASEINGAGRGVDGDDTGLVLHAVEFVRAARPRWVAFENSPRLMHRGGERVLSGLEAAGFQVWALCLRAQDVGCPMARERLFIVGRALDAGAAKKPLGAARQPRTTASTQPLLGDRDGARRLRKLRPDPGGPAARFRDDWSRSLGRHLRMVAPLPAGMACPIAEAYGDSIPPQLTEAIGRSILQVEGELSE